MPSRQVWFIRHAESMANAGACDEPVDQVPLTPKGFDQAEALANIFTSAPSLIICSPYIRTQQTASPTRNRFPHVPCEIWPVQEFTYLKRLTPEEWILSTPQQRQAIAENYWRTASPDYVDGPGMESFNQLLNRVKMIFEKLEKSQEAFTVVFTHNVFLLAARMLGELSDLSPEEMMRRQTSLYRNSSVPNCGIVKAEVIDGRLTLKF
jgi:broad specificity phosphatase PhoE